MNQKFKRIARRILTWALILLLLLSFILSLPLVQTFFAKKVTHSINNRYNTSIEIDKIAITVFGKTAIKNVLIRDHRKDTLFFAQTINTHIIDLKDWYDGNLKFDDVLVDQFEMKLIQYKGENDLNLNVFVDSFNSKEKDKPSTFLMSVNKAQVTNARFRYLDYNKKNCKIVDFKNINTSADDLLIQGPNVTMDVTTLDFLDDRDLHVENVKARFSYTLSEMKIEDIVLTTKNSKLSGDVIMRYDRKDFADFNNKVVFEAHLDNAIVVSKDLTHFYKEFSTDQTFRIDTKVKGTLNNLTFYELDLEGDYKMDFIGDITFSNLFGKSHQPFAMAGDIKKLTTNYESLTRLFPNLLGQRLPKELKFLKTTTCRGTTIITRNSVTADIQLQSAIGNVGGIFVIDHLNTTKNPTYQGDLELDRFNLGHFVSNKDLGRVTAKVNIDGEGFDAETLNSKLIGTIRSLHFKKYNYSNITLDGFFKKPLFEGVITANDPNLKMTFDGLVNFKKSENEYLFKSTIAYADLYKIKLSTKDTISLLKGDLTINLKGTTIDDVRGSIAFKNATYTNPRKEYVFEDFEVNSQFDSIGVRTIMVDSKDIINGSLKGKFRFEDYQKIIENSLGSMYSYYKPHALSQEQFVNFEFDIHNQIVDIFVPQLSLGQDTYLKGEISTATKDFKLQFRSPEMNVEDKTFYKVDLNVDNKQLLYNTSIKFDSLETKGYTYRDFSCTNKTINDTLFVQTLCKGGKQNRDKYQLNIYHTINKDNQSVVGFNESFIDFKNYKWQINQGNKKEQTIVFNKDIDKFKINNISIKHDSISMMIGGEVRDSTFKNIDVVFTDVPVQKITPTIDRLQFGGRLNGMIKILQNKGLYQPKATITVEDFSINKRQIGNFNADIQGTSDLKYFEIILDIVDGDKKPLAAKGSITVDKESTIDLDVKLKDLNLEPISPLGGTIITDIRGLLSGRMSFVGNILDPKVNGRFYVNKGGLKVPYLNVDYVFDDQSIVDVTESQFIVKRVGFSDALYQTRGQLGGHITHHVFADWLLDLAIKGENLLVLNTQDSETAVYYGKAFAKGEASIKGPTNALVMDVKAKSRKGTEIKIPISDSESLGDNSFIKFISPNDKLKNTIKKSKEIKEYKGLEMAFDFDITPEAVLEVIIDRESGHGIKGSGFGNILLDINTLGKFNMWGDFIAHKGMYHFKYGGLIDKKFEVKNGGSIRWEGDPFKAVLNLEAIYKTEANPSVLLENSSLNRTVPVNVTIKLTDQLIKPEVDFLVDFPTLGSIQKSEIQFALNEKNTRQTQALYLLSSGGFLSTSGVGQNAVTGNLFERASSLINGALEDEDSKLKVGLNYVQRNNTALVQTEGRVGLTFKSPISERVSINGKFGVPTGVSQSGVIGEGSLDWRLSKDESLYASVFNKENDINYFGERIGYTQGVGLSYKVDFNTLKSFMEKVRQPQKEVPLDQQELKIPDSFVIPKKTAPIKKKTDTKKLYKDNIPVYE